MKRSIIITIAAVLVISGACHKENSNTANTYASLSDFFQKHQAATQHFSFANSAGGVIGMSKGTKIHFPSNAFTDLNNTAINGQVDIEVKQLLSPADMILNDIPSVTYGQALESGGEFFIGATAGGKAVRLATGKKVQVELPALGVNMDNMKVFNGYAWANDSIPLNGSAFNWTANNNAGNVVQRDSLSVYNLFCDSIKWINCDKLLGGTRASCYVLLGNCPVAAQTRVFVHYTGRNSVISLSLNRSDAYFTGSLVALPVTIIGICISDGRLWASVTKTSLQDGQSYTMDFSETNDEALKATLSSLQ